MTEAKISKDYSLSCTSLEEDVPKIYEGGNGKGHSRKSSFGCRSALELNWELQNELDRFSESAIRGSLADSELEIRREATRTTILKCIANTEEYDADDFVLEEDRLPIANDGEEFTRIDPELITWGFDNPEEPRHWKLSKKIYIVLFVSLYTFVSPMSASILSPAVKDLATEFDITSSTIKALVTSIHILAWAIGPLVVAPLSENYKLGRRPVLGISCWLSFLFNLSCAFSQSTTQIIVLRFVCGLFSAVPLNVSPAVVSDMFDARSRNISLAGVFLIPFIGAAIAPVIGGFIVASRGWRWVLYTLAIINGSIALLGTFFYPETYSPALLHQKAKALRKATGNQNLHTIYELSNRGFSFAELKTTVQRPVVMLFTDPMVIGLGSFMALIYGYLYLMIVTFPSVYTQTYGFSQKGSSLVYLSLGIGFILGVAFWTTAVGFVYGRLSEANGEAKPEYRLPCLFASSAIIPIGLLWYGWSAQMKLHWLMPCTGSGIFAFGLVCVFQVLQAYLIDANPKFAASSISASAIFRCFFGFGFPLFGAQMYEKLGYGWGNTLCAGLAIAIGVPFPIFCYKYGEQIRHWTCERAQRAEEARAEK